MMLLTINPTTFMPLGSIPSRPLFSPCVQHPHPLAQKHGPLEKLRSLSQHMQRQEQGTLESDQHAIDNASWSDNKVGFPQLQHLCNPRGPRAHRGARESGKGNLTSNQQRGYWCSIRKRKSLQANDRALVEVRNNYGFGFAREQWIY